MTPRSMTRSHDFAAGLHHSAPAGLTGGLSLDPTLSAEVAYRRERVASAAYGRRRGGGRRAARRMARSRVDDSGWMSRWTSWPLSVSRRRSSAVGENLIGSRG